MDVTRPLLCDANEAQLVIIDLQTRLANAMEEAERNSVIRNAGLLLQVAKLLEVPIIVSEQYPKGLGGMDESIRVMLPSECNPLEKTSFSLSGNDEFESWLLTSRRAQYILCGMEAHVCVLQTALDLCARGKQVFVVEDAVCSRLFANKQNALHRLRQHGAIVTNTESVVLEWLRDAKHQFFKTVSSLIK